MLMVSNQSYPEALKCVLDYVEKTEGTNSHLILSNGLRPSKVRTQKSALSMKTLNFHKTLGGFERLNVARIAYFNNDERLMQWSQRYWWTAPLLGLITMPLWAPFLLVASSAALLVGIVGLIAVLVRHLCQLCLQPQRSAWLLLVLMWMVHLSFQWMIFPYSYWVKTAITMEIYFIGCLHCFQHSEQPLWRNALLALLLSVLAPLLTTSQIQ